MSAENFEYNGKIIGTRVGDTVYKSVYSSKGHVCWKYDAWGVQYEALKNWYSSGVDQLMIVDKDTDIMYLTDVNTMVSRGTIDTLNPADGEQIFLPRAEWEQVEEWSKQ